MKTIIEPFRIKVVEPIRMTTLVERQAILARAKHNLFAILAEDVLIDLLTDSGTAAMSAEQWAAIMRGDESYAGARSYVRFEQAIRELTGFKHIIPTHQGRAAERILFGAMLEPDTMVPNNTHFDTTRANVETSNATAVDLLCPEAKDLSSEAPFKGNMDVGRLRALLKEQGHKKIPLVMMTITNNSGGGQPVSLANLKEVAALTRAHSIPLYLDACRFAENAYLIKLRETGQAQRSVREIAEEIFSLAQGCTMSAKKDGLANIGGFVATRDDELAQSMRNALILTEGFPTYGGMAGRDLEAIAVGLGEVLDEDYLQYRLASTRYVADRLHAMGVPLVRPVGAHAIYLDARRFLPHLSPLQYPGQALACALYVEGGIRSCEIGTVMFGKHDPVTQQEVAAERDLVRLAIPRRVYTQSHMDYVLEILAEVWRKREEIGGMKIVWQPPTLRHFSAHFQPEASV